MEMAVKTAERAARSAGWRRRRRRRGELLPRRRYHGGAPPLSPFLHGFLGALPMEMGSMGRQKRGFGGWKFMGGGILHELGFPSLYRLSDFRHPLIGLYQNGSTGRVQTPIGLILGLKSSYGKL